MPETFHALPVSVSVCTVIRGQISDACDVTTLSGGYSTFVTRVSQIFVQAKKPGNEFVREPCSNNLLDKFICSCRRRNKCFMLAATSARMRFVVTKTKPIVLTDLDYHN